MFIEGQLKISVIECDKTGNCNHSSKMWVMFLVRSQQYNGYCRSKADHRKFGVRTERQVEQRNPWLASGGQKRQETCEGHLHESQTEVDQEEPGVSLAWTGKELGGHPFANHPQSQFSSRLDGLRDHAEAGPGVSLPRPLCQGLADVQAPDRTVSYVYIKADYSAAYICCYLLKYYNYLLTVRMNIFSHSLRNEYNFGFNDSEIHTNHYLRQRTSLKIKS